MLQSKYTTIFWFLKRDFFFELSRILINPIMVDEGKIKSFWSKSVENRDLCDQALSQCKLNAAASRYYYALYLAFFALFERKGIPVPVKIFRDGLWKNNPTPSSWPKKELHNEADIAIGKGVRQLLWDAWNCRLKGDYSDISVESREINAIRIQADTLFSQIEKEVLN
jgi:hypothetical protein